MVDKFDPADIVVLNSCTVKNPSQEAFATLLRRAQAQKKTVVAAGCVPQAEPTLADVKDCSVVGVTNISRICEVVGESLKGHIVKLLEHKELPQLCLPKIRKNKHVEIVPMSTGCLGQCTFCKTRQARGTLMSYDIATIVQRVKQAVEEGVTEIWLTSEDSGTYGRDIGHTLPELCWEVLGVLRPHNVIKIGMTNPPFILEHMEEMAAILRHPQVYSHMHIPVQSGSNAVLDSMAREYTVEDFVLLCDYLAENVAGVTFATDIICGFPTETEEDFDKTLDLVKKYKFPSLFISQFYPRPGTVAADMKKLDTKVVKSRSTELTKLFESYRTYDSLLGTEQRVWVTDIETNKKNAEAGGKGETALVGHTKFYVKVIIREVDPGLLGRCVKVKITEVQKWHVVGVVTDRNVSSEVVQPVSHYKREFQKTKVNFRARERLHKLKAELAAKCPVGKRKRSAVSERPRGHAISNIPWMEIAYVAGTVLVLLGILMVFLGK